MGHGNAAGMAGMVEEGHVSLQAAVRWHLAFNHFPAVAEAWVPIALEVIEHLQEEGDPDEVFKGPDGRSFPAVWIADGLHLETFIYF